jgi:hypothetical protein
MPFLDVVAQTASAQHVRALQSFLEGAFQGVERGRENTVADRGSLCTSRNEEHSKLLSGLADFQTASDVECRKMFLPVPFARRQFQTLPV